VALLALIQSTVFSGLRVFGVSPDLVLVIVVTWVLVRGQPEGILAALVGGASVAALSGGPRVIIAFLFVACSLLIGFSHDHLPRLVGIIPYLAVTMVTILYKGTLIFWMQTTHQPVYWPGMLVQVLVPAVLLNLLLLFITYNLAMTIDKSLRPPTAEWQ
jgi:rod shape-determining protein MreD